MADDSISIQKTMTKKYEDLVNNIRDLDQTFITNMLVLLIVFIICMLLLYILYTYVQYIVYIVHWTVYNCYF